MFERSFSILTAPDFSKLHIAASKGDVVTVEVLLQSGANIELTTLKHISPLHVASQHGHLHVVKLLIQNGANLNSTTAENFTPLHLALQQSQFEVSKFLIKEGADVNACDGQSWTPLHTACFNGFSLAIVKALLRRGSNINAKNNYDKTALHLASASNHVEIVCCLIDNGADVKAVDTTKWTPLHRPVADSHLKVAEVLLKEGADVNSEDGNGWTPLHYAAEAGDVRVFELLLKYGADVNAKNDENGTPLHIAVQYEHPSLVNILLQRGSDVNAKIHEKAVHHINHLGKSWMPPPDMLLPICFPLATPLHLAAMAGNVEMMKSLLNKGAYFDAEAPAGTCSLPIDFANVKGNVNAIRLLELVAKLFQALKLDDISQIGVCIRDGAVVNARDKSGRSPLYYASGTGNIVAVRMLLRSAANVTQTTNAGITALYKAAHKGYAKIVATLLQYAVKELQPTELHYFINAKITAEIPEDARAKRIASGRKALRTLCEEQGFKLERFHAFNKGKTTAKNSTALHITAQKNKLKIAKLLLKHGALYNFKNQADKTPSDLAVDQEIIDIFQSVKCLFEAVKTGNEEKVTQLLQKYKDIVNARDNNGEATTLYWAVHNGHTGIVQLLLRSGANPTFITYKGNTPLHIASSRGNDQAVQILLQHVLKSDKYKLNMFINAQTTVGRTSALHIAATVDIAKSLLQHGAIYNVKNKDGKTPLDLAEEDIKELLEVTNEVFEGARKGDPAIICKIEGLKRDVFAAITNARNEQDQTALQVSVSNSTKHQCVAGKLAALMKRPD